MVQSNSSTWKLYLTHVLSWEGKTSSDPRDTAASCAPTPGAIHTNKGVTFCTFKTLAAKIGITPVTYKRFLALTDNEIGLFIYEFYKSVSGSMFPDSVALSMTEAAWGSGAKRAIKHLQDALNVMGKKVEVTQTANAQTAEAANSVSEEELFKQYWIQRKAYIDFLTSQKKYAMYKNGWNNRINSFLSKINPGTVIAGVGFFGILGFFF